MALKIRSETNTEDTWDLSPMYNSIELWEDDLAEVDQQIPKIDAFRGKLAESAESLESALRCFLALSRKTEKIYYFASLLCDQDTTDSFHLGMLERATGLYTRLSTSASFLTPELLSIESSTLKTYLGEERLRDLARMVNEIVRYKPHTLSQNEERLLARGTEVFLSPNKIFSQLNNADLDFGSIEIDGKNVPLTHSSYLSYLKHSDRRIRKQAYEQYYGGFESHKHTMAATLSSSIKTDVFLSSVKNFSSAREKALFSDNISADVYDNLIQTVSSRLKPLHRYYQFRKQVLKLESPKIYDTYIPIVEETTITYPYEQAVETICRSVEPLGADYAKILRAGLTSKRWVDRYENKGKRSGAFASGCYDSPPYILINYKEDDLSDLFTLAHEAGHAMHSYYSRQNQSYQDSNYTIFVAEVASTFNEQLLYRQLKKDHAENPEMLKYLVNHQLDSIKSTLYRQAMFAEFEHLSHKAAENGEALSLAHMRNLYRGLLEKYFGPAVDIEGIDELEFTRIPHFYSAFYVYKYATGLAAAVKLELDVVEGRNSALENYLRFLSAGCSKLPLELLKDAGVDIAQPEPIVATLEVFDSLLNGLEKLV